MKKILLLVSLILAPFQVVAQTGCTVGGGVTCTANLNLWLLPQHYQNWGVIPWNNNAIAIDAFVSTTILKAPTGNQTITQSPGTWTNINGINVFGSPSWLRFGATANTPDSALTRTGPGLFSLDTTSAGNGLATLNFAGLTITGSGGTVNQGLCSNGTTVGSFCNFLLSSTSFFYQTVDLNTVAQTQRSALNFNSYFTASDSASPSRTTIGLQTTGSEGKLVTAAAAGTSGNCALWDASGGIGDATVPCALSVVQKNCLSVSCAGGSTYVSGTTYTNSSGVPVVEQVSMTFSGPSATGGDAILSFVDGGISFSGNGVYNQCNGAASVMFVVATGATFSATAAKVDGCSGSTATITAWSESSL
jgi:hypothetical protein